MANPPPDKHELMLKLLEHGSVFMHLDPRREGVVVPLHFRSNPQLVLQIGLNFPIPIRDLEIDAEGVRCTLSFNRQPFYCIVPWSGVYALVGEDGQVTVWPSELPPELMQPNEAPTASAGTQAVRSRKPKDKSTSTKKPPRTAPLLVESAPSESTAPVAESTAQPAVAVAASEGSTGEAANPESSSGDAPKRFTRSGREVPPWLRVVK
ncbi:MAG: ClpXP protease specificity-enhancing factor SspB [Polyangiales bacterium]